MLIRLVFWQKHPHVIFEARTKASKGCANSGNMEWRGTYRRSKHISGLQDDELFARATGLRFPRDVSEATKYIETTLVIDKAMASTPFDDPLSRYLCSLPGLPGK